MMAPAILGRRCTESADRSYRVRSHNSMHRLESRRSRTFCRSYGSSGRLACTTRCAVLPWRLWRVRSHARHSVEISIAPFAVESRAVTAAGVGAGPAVPAPRVPRLWPSPCGEPGKRCSVPPCDTGRAKRLCARLQSQSHAAAPQPDFMSELRQFRPSGLHHAVRLALASCPTLLIFPPTTGAALCPFGAMRPLPPQAHVHFALITNTPCKRSHSKASRGPTSRVMTTAYAWRLVACEILQDSTISRTSAAKVVAAATATGSKINWLAEENLSVFFFWKHSERQDCQ